MWLQNQGVGLLWLFLYFNLDSLMTLKTQTFTSKNLDSCLKKQGCDNTGSCQGGQVSAATRMGLSI